MTESYEQCFSLRVPSSKENLAMIRSFVNSVGNRSGLSQSEVDLLELAVDEACANVIEHAYGGADATKDVSVRATIDDDAIQIEVVDRGKGFNPDAVPVKSVSQLVQERASGGLGMRLMKQLMDEVHYQMIPGVKNELRMVKRINKSSSKDKAE
jgi:anti-sigma regulatory factor (Ser/Thr protein kinase)